LSKKNKKNIDFYTVESTDTELVIKPIEPVILINSNSFDFRKIKFDIYKKVTINLNELELYDSYLIILINKLESYCLKYGIDFSIETSNTEVLRFIDFLGKAKYQRSGEEDNKSAIYKHVEEVGSNIRALFKDVYDFIKFFGELITKFFILIFNPKKMRWVDFPLHFTRTGVMALPISALIVFLIGMISGYQGAIQLKQFGADSFIADLVGISLTRELAPLMVAILVAGRSGSAFAAQLGTMKVTEEVDALVSMGFDKMEFLVLPRVFAVTLAMPILVLICNVIGVVGGLIAAISTLDITIVGYINRLQVAVSFMDIFTGLFKSLIFGFIVATIGCYKGLSVTNDADAVGRFTTASVVAGVFMIVFTDAVFTFVFNSLGI
jgi:phospholipid/cholesterol/gamma-HCH transport system permease protein